MQCKYYDSSRTLMIPEARTFEVLEAFAVNFVRVAEGSRENQTEAKVSRDRNFQDVGEHIRIELIGEVELDAEAWRKSSSLGVELVVEAGGEEAGLQDVFGNFFEGQLVGARVARGEVGPNKLGGVGGEASCGSWHGVFVDIDDVGDSIRFRLEREVWASASGHVGERGR